LKFRDICFEVFLNHANNSLIIPDTRVTVTRVIKWENLKNI